MRRTRTVAGLLALALLLALSASALAAAPTPKVFAQADGHASAIWVLATGQQALAIEVATSPTTDDDGLFLDDAVVDGDLLDPAAISWVSNVALAPGTYYVHLATYDPVTDDAVWSSVATVVITTSGTATTPAVGTLPGTGTTPAVVTSTTGGSSTTAGDTTSTATTTSSSSSSSPVSASSVAHGVSDVRELGRARLSFSRTSGGPSATRFATKDGSVYVAIRWLALPGSTRDPRVVWIRPSGRRTKSTTITGGESLGETVSAAISQRLLRGRPGRWTVELTIGGRTVSTASFVVGSASSGPAAVAAVAAPGG